MSRTEFLFTTLAALAAIVVTAHFLNRAYDRARDNWGVRRDAATAVQVGLLGLSLVAAGLAAAMALLALLFVQFGFPVAPGF